MPNPKPKIIKIMMYKGNHQPRVRTLKPKKTPLKIDSNTITDTVFKTPDKIWPVKDSLILIGDTNRVLKHLDQTSHITPTVMQYWLIRTTSHIK